MLAELSRGETEGLIELLVILLGIVCLGGAAYMAYLRNVLATVLLLIVAVVSFFIAA